MDEVWDLDGDAMHEVWELDGGTMDEVWELDGVISKGHTAKAVLCVVEGETVWIPKSVIHDDSEVFQGGQVGKLVLKRWWAVKQGWVDG